MPRVRFTQRAYYGEQIIEAGEVRWLPSGVNLSAYMVVLPPDPIPAMPPDDPAPDPEPEPDPSLIQPEGS